MPGTLVIAAKSGLRTSGRMRAPESQCSPVTGAMATADNRDGDRYMTSTRLVRAFGVGGWDDGTHQRRPGSAPSQAPVPLLASGYARDGFDHGPLCRFCAGGAER